MSTMMSVSSSLDHCIFSSSNKDSLEVSDTVGDSVGKEKENSSPSLGIHCKT